MDDADDIRYEPGAWVVLDALVKRGSLTMPQMQEETGLSIPWVRRVRLMLEAAALAKSEEQLEGRVRYLVTYPTEHGRKVHKAKMELDAMLKKGIDSMKRRD